LQTSNELLPTASLFDPLHAGDSLRRFSAAFLSLLNLSRSRLLSFDDNVELITDFIDAAELGLADVVGVSEVSIFDSRSPVSSSNRSAIFKSDSSASLDTLFASPFISLIGVDGADDGQLRLALL
jgi:hypothetical protein